MNLYTYKLLDGRFVTYAGRTEPAAFNRANAYHPGAVVSREFLHHVCKCPSKRAAATREGGWLICDNPDCAGFIS